MADTKVLFSEAAKERLSKTSTKHLLKIAFKFADFETKIQKRDYDVIDAIKIFLDEDSKQLIFEDQIKPQLAFDHKESKVPIAVPVNQNDLLQDEKQKQIIETMKHAAMGAAKKIQVTSEDVSEDFLDDLI